MPILRMNDNGDVVMQPRPINPSPSISDDVARQIGYEAPPLLGVEPNSDDWYIQQAVEQYRDENLDIDDSPTVSASENGAWVSAWVWVEKADDEEPEPEPGRGTRAWRAAKDKREQDFREGA